MITVKIIVFFFKVKLFDSYFFGELKIPVLLLPPKSSLWNEDYVKKPECPDLPKGRARPDGGG
jgi:hypothetical protein